MDSENERILVKEFVDRYKCVLYWPLSILGFTRFDLKDNKIVNLTFNTLVYRILVLATMDIGVGYLIYTSVISRNYLKVPDGLCVLQFGAYANLLLVNMTFVNRKSGLIMIDKGFKIDSHLGREESNFMRDKEAKTFLAMSIMVAITNVSGGVLLYKAYDVSLRIHFVGSIFFFWLFFCYVDYCFFLVYFTFIAIRVKYLNVALAKIGGVNINYVSERSLMNVILWKKSYNELVTFHSRMNFEDFVTAFQMVFEMLRLIETFYQFPIVLGIFTNVTGTFVSSQTFIDRIKDPNVLEQERVFIIIGWAGLTWGFMLLVTFLLDLFEQQIEQTKLICAYIQLKPNKSAKIYKLTKTILRLLERRNPKFSAYNLFYLDTGFLVRIAATTLVYITVQLQLAFPNLPNPISNVTSSD